MNNLILVERGRLNRQCGTISEALKTEPASHGARHNNVAAANQASATAPIVPLAVGDPGLEPIAQTLGWRGDVHVHFQD